MDYWISRNGTQVGPHSFDQLQQMWQQGQLTTETLYFDSIRAEWKLLQGLFERNRQLFSVEEAFVRLGENRQSGCLIVVNREEYLHLFFEQGFVVCAIGSAEQGEVALARALRLEEATYEWFVDSKPPEANLRVNVREYALKHSIARDVRVHSQAKRKSMTVSLSGAVLDQAVNKRDFHYVLVGEEDPELNLKLNKATHVVGREDHCDLVIEDPRISRKHCLLEASEQIVKVKDLDSSNGTLVNGIKITDGYLHVGDQLSLGGYAVRLHKEQKRAPAFTG